MNDELARLPTETVGTCINCERSDSERDLKFEGWLCLKPPYQIRKCINCKLRWLSPRPTGIGYEIVYNAENYFSAQAGTGVAYEGMLDARTRHFGNRLSALHEYFPEQKSLRILDYGAATGEFVLNAMKCGHVCAGVEFSADARRVATEKNRIQLYSPDEFAGMNSLFDVVHMNHVFEHMPDPADHLIWCRNRLVENGLLVIEVPQQFDNHIDRLKRFLRRGGMLKDFGAFSLHHTYFFSTRNLKQLVERSGFHLVHMTTDVAGPRLGGKHYIRSGFIRCASWLADRLSGGGDNIEIYARRKA